MVDVAVGSGQQSFTRQRAGSRSSLRKWAQRKSSVAFLMALPLILLIGILVIYPAFFAMYLATLNKSMTKFVAFGNFQYLFKRDTFWMVVEQSCIFAITSASSS